VNELLWARDGSGLYLTRHETNGEPYVALLKPGTARAVKVLQQASGLCWLPLQ